MTTTVKILKLKEPHPRHKLADAEVHFVGGDLDGLKLVGFSIWQRSDGHGLHVTLPARQYTMHGQKKDFHLLRAIEDRNAVYRFRRLILDAFEVEPQTSAEAAS